jgi:hypothetical protein
MPDLYANGSQVLMPLVKIDFVRFCYSRCSFMKSRGQMSIGVIYGKTIFHSQQGIR